jgi:hypothetical protein
MSFSAKPVGQGVGCRVGTGFIDSECLPAAIRNGDLCNADRSEHEYIAIMIQLLLVTLLHLYKRHPRSF